MLPAIIIILLCMWGLGMITSHTLGGFIYVLLALAIAAIIIQIIIGIQAEKLRRNNS